MGTLLADLQNPDASERQLGRLLEVHRLGTHTSLAALSISSGFSAREISDVESGQHDLAVDELAELVAHYAVDRSDLPPMRSVVTIDLAQGSVSATKSRRKCAEPADLTLLRYVSLVYSSQGLSAGAKIPIKEIDLTVLRAALALRRPAVEGRLRQLLARRVGSDTKAARGMSLFAAVGLAGATVAAGSILLIPAGASAGSGSESAELAASPPAVVAVAPLPPAPSRVVEVPTPQAASSGVVSISESAQGAPQTLGVEPIAEFNAALAAATAAAPSGPAPVEESATRSPVRRIESAPAPATAGGDLGTSLVIER